MTENDLFVVGGFGAPEDTVKPGFSLDAAILRAAQAAFMRARGVDPESDPVAALEEAMSEPLGDFAFAYRQWRLCGMLDEETDPEARLRIAFSLGELKAQVQSAPLLPVVSHGKKMRGGGNNLDERNAELERDAAARHDLVAQLIPKAGGREGVTLDRWIVAELGKRGLTASIRQVQRSRTALKKIR